MCLTVCLSVSREEQDRGVPLCELWLLRVGVGAGSQGWAHGAQLGWAIQNLVRYTPQPNPSNKLAIVHILGLLSNLFTTLDVSHHEDDHEGSELRKLPVPQGPNPVGDVVIAVDPTPQPCGSVIVTPNSVGNIVIVPWDIMHLVLTL